MPVGSERGLKERLRNGGQVPHWSFPSGNLERCSIHHRLLTQVPEQLAPQAESGSASRLRALVRQPAVLILDEATSALDPQTEADVNMTLRQAARDRTVISVTHRLASVTQCGEIFVMDRGRLVGQASHEELLSKCEVYSSLWQLDSSRPDAT